MIIGKNWLYLLYRLLGGDLKVFGARAEISTVRPVIRIGIVYVALLSERSLAILWYPRRTRHYLAGLVVGRYEEDALNFTLID